MTLKILRYVKYLGPFVFVLGLAYTSFYPEAKLLAKSKGFHRPTQKSPAVQEAVSTGSTPFDFVSHQPADEVSLSKCRVWICISAVQDLPDTLLSCSVESALIHIKNASRSICLIYDRSTLHDIHTSAWVGKLKKSYGDLIVTHAPEYSTVFAGTVFEETYVNSADLSYMAPAMIWALLWKHGGLHLVPDTILVSGLQSYYNFVLLNSTSNGAVLSLTQFTERHHDLPGQILSQFMEQAQRLKQLSREKQAGVIKMGIPVIRDNTQVKLSPVSESDWSRGVEKYCGRRLSKSLVKHLCHDTEIVPPDLMPKASLKVLKRLSRRFPDVLAIKFEQRQDFEILLQNEEVNNKLQKLCPVTLQTE